MYWNKVISIEPFAVAAININMRCIEICNYLNKQIASGLTLTWDVLKWYNTKNKSTFFKININMRCIEIALNAWVDSNYNMININMRCIEITIRR